MREKRNYNVLKSCIRNAPMKADTSLEITTLLKAWGCGEIAALDRLIPLVYRELKRMAEETRISRVLDRGQIGLIASGSGALIGVCEIGWSMHHPCHGTKPRRVHRQEGQDE